MARIRMLGPLIPKADGRTVPIEAKRADPFYQSEEHRQFRDAVLRNARYQCEWVENGQRCSRAAPRIACSPTTSPNAKMATPSTPPTASASAAPTTRAQDGPSQGQVEGDQPAGVGV
jgi:hypothetical protein